MLVWRTGTATNANVKLGALGVHTRGQPLSDPHKADPYLLVALRAPCVTTMGGGKCAASTHAAAHAALAHVTVPAHVSASVVVVVWALARASSRPLAARVVSGSPFAPTPPAGIGAATSLPLWSCSGRFVLLSFLLLVLVLLLLLCPYSCSCS